MPVTKEKTHNKQLRMRVVLWQGCDIWRLTFMYEPVMQTLAQGFAAGGAHVATGCIRNPDAVANMTWLHSWVQRGDFFAWIGPIGSYHVAWGRLRELGVHTVHYKTEPVPLISTKSKCMFNRHIKENWEYSMLNYAESMRCANASANAPRPRYVPPGAYRHAIVNASAPSSASPVLLFLGNPYEGGRHKCYGELSRRLVRVGAMLSYTYKAFGEEAFGQRLSQRATVCVNLHKKCGARAALEAVRVAQVMSFGDCLVLSERAHALDESSYEGIVRFADNVSDIAAAFARLVEDGGRWRSEAAAAAHRFRRTFAPTAIFRRAGVYRAFGLEDPVRPDSLLV